MSHRYRVQSALNEVCCSNRFIDSIIESQSPGGGWRNTYSGEQFI
jgi:hypothetical protein